MLSFFCHKIQFLSPHLQKPAKMKMTRKVQQLKGPAVLKVKENKFDGHEGRNAAIFTKQQAAAVEAKTPVISATLKEAEGLDVICDPKGKTLTRTKMKARIQYAKQAKTFKDAILTVFHFHFHFHFLTSFLNSA